MKLEEVEQSIIKFLKNNILAEEVEIDASNNLSELGVDSYSIVEILLFIERKYGFVIPDDELKPDNFINVTSISKTVVEVADRI
ncbi:MAG: acyl carrier protein [Brumimicrobium sp.]